MTENLFGENNSYSLKELYEVTLKATYPMKVGDRTFEEGEVIAEFEKVSLANFQEVKTHVAARGGFDNRALINWDETKEVNLQFTQGVFTTAQFALLSNSRILTVAKDDEDWSVRVPVREELESDASGNCTLKYLPYDTTKVFVYDAESGEKLTYTLSEKVLHISTPYKNLLVRYTQAYNGGSSVIVLGRRLVDGYLRLEGKSQLKDDNTGKVVTELIVIPKLKLMSDLSMRLGTEAKPVVANFSAVGYPVGSKGRKEIMTIVNLNDDLQADIL